MTPVFPYVANKDLNKTILEVTSSINKIAHRNINITQNQLKSSRDQKVDHVIDIFDKYILDNMRVHWGDFPPYTDKANGYYRSDSYKQIIPDEVVRILEKDLLNNKYIYFGSHEHIDFYSCVFNGNKIFLTPKISVLLTREKTEPYCSLPIQELFAEFIKCGINPINNIPTVGVSYQRPQELYKVNRQKQFSPKIKALKVEIEKIFNFQISIIPFSSCTAANEAVMRALKEEIQNEQTYVHPYWYYENLPTAKRLFELCNDYKNSKVALINIEPTNYLEIEDGIKLHSPEEIIHFYHQEAIENTNNLYTLVLDTTVSPFKNNYILSKFVALPNTRLIMTISLSKYQRGDRRYFFGIAIIPLKDEIITSQINRSLGKVGGRLTRRHREFFPEFSYSSFNEVAISIEKLNSKIATLCFNSNNFIIKPYTFNSILYPNKVLMELLKNTLDRLSIEEAIKFTEDFNDGLWNNVLDSVKQFNSKNIEFGDSFGLRPTRVTVQGGQTKIVGKDLELKLPRISPGSQTRAEELIDFTKTLIGNIDQFIKTYDFNKHII